ncbi:MAG: TspO/MBR family protein [Candidatus Shapirobacteria bacterium]
MIKKLVIALLLPQLAGGLGALFTTPAIPGWYAALNKPPFSPPGWLFAPVWTTLYLLMGYSFYLIWQEKPSKQRKKAIALFLIQLALNTLWSILFFGLRSPLLGLLDIMLLLFLIIFAFVSFLKINKTAGYLLFPYLLWVSFATILNFSLFLLNQ